MLIDYSLEKLKEEAKRYDVSISKCIMIAGRIAEEMGWDKDSTLKQVLENEIEIAKIQKARNEKYTGTDEAGLVSSRKDGLWVNYYITDGSSSPYASAVLGNLRHWLEYDPQIAELVAKLPMIRREDVCKRQLF